MKKAITAAAVVLACAMLCGCQSLEERILNQSGYTEDADYIDYDQLQQSGQLNEDGRYISQDTEKPGDPYAQIHVTFAENTFLDCSYYWDKELTDPIDTSYCYIDPGECIYAAEPVSTNNISSRYTFSGFKVYEYDENGNRLGELAADASQEPLTLCIPADFTGTELSVEPCGVYNARTLSLADVWYDADGNANDAGGTWYVNDEIFSKGYTELDAFASYTVRCEYDPEVYYFVSSSVETTGDTADGQIAFAANDNSDGSYVLELHPYTNVTLDDSGKNLVSATVNDQAAEIGKKEVSLGKLKAGDIITLVCKDGYKITCSADITAEQTETDAGQQYIFTVPQDGITEVSFVISKLETKNVELDVDKNGSVLSAWNNVSGTVADWFRSGPGEESILTVSNGTDSYDYEELQNRSDISLCETDSLTVTVNPQDGVTVTVSVNGGAAEELTGTLVLSYDEVSKLTIRVTSVEGE